MASDKQSHELVLLCGFPRSGTTWLSKILDSDPRVHLVSEPDKSVHGHLKLGRVPHCLESSEDQWLREYQAGLHEVQAKLDLNLVSSPFFRKHRSRLPYPMYVSLMAALKALNGCSMKALGKPVQLARRSMMNGQERLVWKSVNQSSNLDFLRTAFPEMKVIYILRNPYDAIGSTLQHPDMAPDGREYQRIWGRMNAPFFQYHAIDLNEIREWDELAQRALRWRIDAESAVLYSDCSSDIYVLGYEDLARAPKGTSEKLFQWLNWDMDGQTYNFMLESTGERPPSALKALFSSGYYGVYRNKNKYVKNTKKQLSASQKQKLDDVLCTSPLMKKWI